MNFLNLGVKWLRGSVNSRWLEKVSLRSFPRSIGEERRPHPTERWKPSVGLTGVGVHPVVRLHHDEAVLLRRLGDFCLWQRTPDLSEHQTSENTRPQWTPDLSEHQTSENTRPQWTPDLREHQTSVMGCARKQKPHFYRKPEPTSTPWGLGFRISLVFII